MKFQRSSIVNRQSSIVNLPSGFTLVELLIGAAILAIAISALLGAFLGQVTLNEHARNLTWAINDANRVMEQMRLRNTNPCQIDGTALVNPDTTPPTPNPAAGYASWDAWLADTGAGGGGKSIQPTPADNELVVVTCRDQANGTCEATDDPIQITVAICWRHRSRVLGECRATGGVGPGLEAWEAASFPNPDDPNVIQSPAMLSTVITCRQ